MTRTPSERMKAVTMLTACSARCWKADILLTIGNNYWPRAKKLVNSDVSALSPDRVEQSLNLSVDFIRPPALCPCAVPRAIVDLPVVFEPFTRANYFVVGITRPSQQISNG